MHHLENIYFGFVNLPLHLSPTLTQCVHSYAVSVAGCVGRFQFQALGLHILCGVTLRAIKRTTKIRFY